MSIKENKALILRFYDLFKRKGVDAGYELFAPEYILHSPTGDMSREQVKQFDTMLVPAFPDAICTINDMVAEGDKVAFRVTWRGTQKGDFMGIPATGKKLEITNTTIVKLAGGKWSECWATVDDLRFLQQMGVIPKQ